MEPGLFLPVTADGATAESFWNDPLTVKYRSQVETMVANTEHGALFGFTKGRVFRGYWRHLCPELALGFAAAHVD